MPTDRKVIGKSIEIDFVAAGQEHRFATGVGKVAEKPQAGDIVARQAGSEDSLRADPDRHALIPEDRIILLIFPVEPGAHRRLYHAPVPQTQPQNLLWQANAQCARQGTHSSSRSGGLILRIHSSGLLRQLHSNLMWFRQSNDARGDLSQLIRGAATIK